MLIPNERIQARPESVGQGVEELVQKIAAEVLKQLDPYLQEQLGTCKPQPSQPDPKMAEQAQALATERERNRILQGQLDLMQLRQEKQHQQIRSYEAEIEQLYQEKQVLEQMIQELPERYRRQVQARLQPIRERIAAIQAENRQLRVDLYHLSYHLHHMEPMDSPGWKVHLPQFAAPHRRDPLALPAVQPRSTEATVELQPHS
ncbi:hypothetical protein [Thermostichus vulcanus]|uniref:hypothetical protein n=1 Tax=Thermostichus vulcanus TaxID=32053 RepID=UPI001FCA50F5|nr:hypothetical protein [Thermostichus vulcanus]